ncbi:hypothetical protein G3N95_14735 [Paraburkholderia sp. Tr-20389]|uniref:hypothetical protein n=1 Tax=Paraburkholderia sp. Tr-20389 TaxID=2703903 RepID=UPI001980BA61|nr:hypothetical protein [Paraburkholderia sp. Tr-20389]MBN3754205.1 hypothetical protein [Paraburkholderia sp. Tr-20389]
MTATDFLEQSRNPVAWRKRAAALRRSADLLWEEFCRVFIAAVAEARDGKAELDLEGTLEALEGAKLLYGLALETALKAWIIENHPSRIEVRVTMDGAGEATHAELKALGVPMSSGRNLLALAEAAELFGDRFQFVLRTDGDKQAMRNICRDLAEVVLWRGRYPVPLASADPTKLDPSVPPKAMAHYMRDWLDPVLDALLQHRGKHAPVR